MNNANTINNTMNNVWDKLYLLSSATAKVSYDEWDGVETLIHKYFFERQLYENITFEKACN